MYLQGLSRETYDLSVDGKVLPPKREDSRNSVAVFLRVLDRAESVDCIAEEFEEGGSIRRVTVFNVNTGVSAVLSVNYGGGKGYTAKILMRKEEVQQELAVDGGVDVAERKLLKVLTDTDYRLEKKKKKTTSFNIPVISDEDGKYAHLEDKFRT
ncbi:MAG: hypothetical protein NTW67_05420 [Candidatus Woesearchaeota archaeon]|nr:hypothetical protein [Candidatus Woesearchaeota archaeon]